jgi:hypothetical protein
MHVQQFVSVAPYFTEGGFKLHSVEELLAEPSFVSCSLICVDQLAGPIVKAIVSKIRRIYAIQIKAAEEDGLSASVDVKVQRLLPNYYPSKPGWHCAFVPRDKYTGQPQFSMVHPKCFHVALTLSNEAKGVSNTEYVISPLKVKLWETERVFHDLHKQVLRIGPDTDFAKDGVFTWHNQRTIYRASPAIRRGIRLSLRFSMLDRPVVQNRKVDTQQVYLLSEENGW